MNFSNFVPRTRWGILLIGMVLVVVLTAPTSSMARVERTSSTEGDPTDGLDAAGSGGMGSLQDEGQQASTIDLLEIRWSGNSIDIDTNRMFILLPLILDVETLHVEFRFVPFQFRKGARR